MRKNIQKNKVRETGIVFAVNNSINRGDCCAVIHKVSKMDNYLDGSWEKFEQCLGTSSVSDFCWRVRPMDNRSNREMIAKLVQNEIKANNGIFPEKNAFIEQK